MVLGVSFLKKTLMCILGFALAASLASCNDKKPAADGTSSESADVTTVVTAETVTTSTSDVTVSSDTEPTVTSEPEVTTSVPVVTTEEPEVTTATPIETTEEPIETTEEPEVTTEVTEESIADTTEEPLVTSEEPIETTEEPPVTEEPEEFDISTANLSEYVTLGQYIGLEVFVSGLEAVSDEDIHRVVKALISTLPSDAMITDRPCEMGDCVNIDYVGRIDGAPISDGTDSDVHIVLGEVNLYPGFEEAIAGMIPGKTETVTVTFPDDYYEDLAGKTVEFEVTLNYIYPDFTDELAKKYFNAESADEYLGEIRTLLEENGNASAAEAKKTAVWTAVLSRSSIIKYPESLVAEKVRESVASYEAQASAYGISYEELFVNVYGMTVDDAEIMMIDSAHIAVFEKLVLYALAKEMALDIGSYTDDAALYEDVVGRIVETASFTTD